MLCNIELIRKLAKTHKWQTMYSKAKEVSSLRLFVNEFDLSDIQIIFLQWLEIYHVLEIDISMNRPFISREVLEDEIRTDAYLTIRKDALKEELSPQGKNSPRKKIDKGSPQSVIFRKG